MLGIFYEWSKKPGNWVMTIIILVLASQLLAALGAPIPRPAWSSELKVITIEFAGRQLRLFDDVIERQEKRIIELEALKGTAPEVQKEIYDELIIQRKNQLEKDRQDRSKILEK